MQINHIKTSKLVISFWGYMEVIHFSYHLASCYLYLLCSKFLAPFIGHICMKRSCRKNIYSCLWKLILKHFFVFFIFKILIHNNVHVKNQEHHVNYFNLDYSLFLHIKFSAVDFYLYKLVEKSHGMLILENGTPSLNGPTKRKII
jgi:hypothetical protein